ncbi:hypothetical protein AB0B30_25540 [Streptomyces narbonensis]|uniref:Secreted protein n=1 Tax=Streptomyces narbonensis TaxID=67333 RepID=A0ABV3CAT8_9ACTN|nr:hypothetical protein [Streptomyces narbonensis]GGW06464.1 hypothetical protein GCM10010230_48500 [Streptomyces narbonensis]
MKSTKVAAIVAGSLVALGAAAPAMAAEALTPTSLNGGLDAIAANGLKTDVLSSTTEGSPVKTVTDTVGQLNEAGKGGSAMLGGLPVGAPLGG